MNHHGERVFNDTAVVMHALGGGESIVYPEEVIAASEGETAGHARYVKLHLRSGVTLNVYGFGGPPRVFGGPPGAVDTWAALKFPNGI